MELQSGMKIVANARFRSMNISYTGSECVKSSPTDIYDCRISIV